MLQYVVTTICVDIFQASEDAAVPISWPKFDAAANAFPFLCRVIFGFARRQNLLKFAEEVVKGQLPLLSSRGLVRYAIGPIGSPSMWYAVSQDTYESKGTSPDGYQLFPSS